MTFGRYGQVPGGLVGQFAGFATSLMTLRVLSYAGLNDEGHGRWREGLARLLDSFKSLEILELRGYWPNRANTICRHAGLGELTSHVDEIPAKKRRVLSVEDWWFWINGDLGYRC